MSDFDAEAERKRLREKYEAEEERRKETQQMSELLLKGATMTNRHCGECGSPIFRYQEQEFCPSCQQVMGGADTAGENPGADPDSASDRAKDAAADGADAADTVGEIDAADEATLTPEASSELNPTATSEPNPTATVGSEPASNGADPTITPDASERSQQADGSELPGIEPKAADSRADSTSATERGSADRSGSSAPTRQTARESLLEALTRHARLAARTDEPRRAAEHLSAANEAAAALDALDGS